MDYFDLLHQAQTNNKNCSVQETRCYKTTFSAPKKDEKKVSSDGIKRFLARREEEEKRKALEAQKKKEELLALRSLDKKSQKRVQVMLKRTKSANKSVMEDAIDNYNTKDTLEGPQQCDEDDYGYVSQEASAFYEKMMAKYEKTPIVNQKQMSREVKDLKAAKDRVKAALDKEAEEQLHPTRKRTKKQIDVTEDDEGICYDAPDRGIDEKKPEEPKEKPFKIPKKAPPPVDFFELMKIAAKKQHEPIIIEKKVEEPERQRPMTKKEKLEYQREQERKNRKINNQTQSNSSDKSNIGEKSKLSKTGPSVDKIMASGKESKNAVKSNAKPERSDKTPVKSVIDVNSNSVKTHPAIKKDVKFGQMEKRPLTSVSKEKNNSPIAKPSLLGSKQYSKDRDVETPKVDVTDIDKEIEMLLKKKQMMLEAAKAAKMNSKTSSSPQNNISQRPIDSCSKNNIKNVLNVPNKKIDSTKSGSSRQNSISEERLGSKIGDQRNTVHNKSYSSFDKPQSKIQNNKSLQPSKQSPSSNDIPSSSTPKKAFMPPRYGPPSKPMTQIKKKAHKRVIDSESEYDSEMDDFIDDGPDESMDYSKHIKEIFGYDKSRYANIDEEECEESSYKTQMIEEKRSARIGLLEDLEDIQREKEEKERAKKRKKLLSKR